MIIEKPFGTDLASAQALNETVHTVFDESQVFRIDHFLGKESVDNILALRFANGLFEPIWNRDHISYVQIDVPETLGIEGRAGFYEGTGAFRDMIVTHLFQVLGFVAMEPPTSLAAKPLRDEKDKVFEALRPIDPRSRARPVRGLPRRAGGRRPIRRPRRSSRCGSRWTTGAGPGCPFYLRSGKALAAAPAGDHARIPRAAPADVPRRTAPTRQGRGNKIVIDFGDPGGSPSPSWPRSPAPPCGSGRRR